jgi:hypothetical protein
MNKFFTLFFVLFLNFSFGATINKKLYILGDSLSTVTNGKIPYITFNEVNSFDQKNPIINLNINDSLLIWVINKDNIIHDFEVNGMAGSSASVPVNDSVLISLKFTSIGCFIYQDPSNYPNQVYLGLGGMINVKDHNHSSFYWNIKEHDSTWNVSIRGGTSVNWANYKPEYFTINSVSNPDINLDPNARITGNVGDTIYVYFANTGRSIHSLHLHGYHATIRYSSQHPSHIGRSKDTFPIEPGETLIISFIPDKTGEYPVHDHNLVAVSGNNLYPNGMISTILINP